jgi:hypothetical protein
LIHSKKLAPQPKIDSIGSMFVRWLIKFCSKTAGGNDLGSATFADDHFRRVTVTHLWVAMTHLWVTTAQ